MRCPGLALFATYTFYGVVTSCASGILGTSFLDGVGIWHEPADVGAVPDRSDLAGARAVAHDRAGQARHDHAARDRGRDRRADPRRLRGGARPRLIGKNAPHGGTQHFTLDVFKVAPGTSTTTLFLGIVFGFLSFAGFEAASTLGEETAHPHRDIPRAILGTAIFGGIYFTVVTAIEMMGFGTDPAGVKAFGSSGSLVGDLGTSYIGDWVGDLVSLGATISAFGCCLACMVGAARLLFAMNRDLVGADGSVVAHPAGHAGAQCARGRDADGRRSSCSCTSRSARRRSTRSCGRARSAR